MLFTWRSQPELGENQMSRHQESNAVLRVALAGALACGLVACGDKQADQAAASNAATKQAAAAPTQAVAAAVAAMSPEQLREAATQAVAEQRLYAPAANNAMEYYLASVSYTQDVYKRQPQRSARAATALAAGCAARCRLTGWCWARPG